MLNYKEFELLKDLLETSCIADIAKNSTYEVFEDENEINENKVNNFKSPVSSIGFRRIKIYRFKK